MRVMADARAEGASYLDVRIPERPVAGGAFATPLPSATPARTSGTTTDSTTGGTNPNAATAAPLPQNPANTGGQPPA
jgi:hypothetical protein